MNISAHQITKAVCFLEDLNRSQEFYTCLNETLLSFLSQQLLTSKEFAFHFVDLVTKKIHAYCDKPIDYETSSIFQLWVELMVGLVDALTDGCVKTAIFDQIPRSRLQFGSRRMREYVSLILAKCAPKLSHST
jgi:hypothetical protein